jgi:hypothetical protein
MPKSQFGEAMPKRFNHVTDMPEIGDVVRYSHPGYETLVLPVTHIEPQGGYTDVWLGYQLGKTTSNFNINHTTGNANTASHGGQWEIVRRYGDPPPVNNLDFAETVTAEEQAFGAEMYDLLSEHNLLPGSYFAKTRVIVAAIEAIRKETTK